jgi:hypothetical protein
MDALEKTPSESARELETVLAIQNNMMHLCNKIRLVQGQLTLKYMLSQSVKEKKALLQTLQERSAAVESGILDAAQTVAGLAP